MSATIVLGYALALTKDVLRPPAKDDVTTTIRRVDPTFTEFAYCVGREAGLKDDELYCRAAALLLQYAAIQLADDLADGDCHYLPSAARVGPGAQWLLAHLFTLMLQRTTVPAATVVAASRDFVSVGEGQQDEVRTEAWRLSSVIAAAERLNGAQYRAHLSLLLANTPFAPWAEQHAGDFGFALHVVGDRTHGDARWSTLTIEEKSQLASLAAARARLAMPSGLETIERQLRLFEHILKA